MKSRRFENSKMMLRKSFSAGLVMLVLFCKITTSESPCGPHYTIRECIRVIVPTAKRTTPQQSLNPLLDPDWIESLEKMGEPTCKLRDIFNMIPNDCRAELLQILHLFVTNSDY